MEKNKKLRLGVIFGGRSGEHEIAIRSAKTVIESVDPEKYDVVPIAIMSDGRWLSPADSVRQFPDHTQKVFRDNLGEASEERLVLTGETRPSVTGLPASSRTEQAGSLRSDIDVV